MRDAITHELAAVGELTAKGIAAALDFEVADVIKELNDMLKNGLVERTKRYGNEYTYWLTQPVVATSNEIPVFAGAKPGSGAGSLTGTTSSPGAAAISYTADSAAAVQELANALDTINTLTTELQTLRGQIEDARDWRNYSIEGAIKAVQSVLEDGIFLTVHSDSLTVFAFDNGYSAKPDELVEVVSMCADLERRLVA